MAKAALVTVPTVTYQDAVVLTLGIDEAQALLGPINDLFLASDKYEGAEKAAVDALWTAAVEAASGDIYAYL